MLAGFPSSVFAGAAEDGIVVGVPKDLGDGISLEYPVQAPANFGNNYWIWIADRKLGEIFFLPEGVPIKVKLAIDPRKANPHAIVFAPLGKWSYLPPGFDPRVQLDLWEGDKGKYVTLQWDAQSGMLEYKAFHAANQLTNWSGSGLQRFTNCRPVDGYPQRAILDLEISTSGGVHTVTASLNGHDIASGSRAGDGAVTLTPLNDSGVALACTLTYSADIALGDGAYLEMRWPKKYEMYVDNVLEKTVLDNRFGNIFRGRAGPKSAGTYALKVRGISDSDGNGNYSTPVNEVVSTRPEPPGEIALQSSPGDWTGVKIQWPVASGSVDGYVVYAGAALDGPVNLVTAITPAAGPTIASGIAKVTMPQIGAAAAAGKWTIVVYSIKSGVLDGFGKTIVVELDATGAIVLGRPNVPKAEVPSASGLQITVPVIYDARHEAGVGLEARLFLVAEGGTVNFNSPDAVANLGTADAKGYKRATLTATVGAAGVYKWIVRISTANNPTLGVLSPNTGLQPEIWISNVAPGAAATVAGYVEA